MKVAKNKLSLVFLFLLSIPLLGAKRFTGNEPLPGNLFIELAKKVNPAVVNIATTQVIRGGRGFYGGMPGDPFQEFLEQWMRGHGGRMAVPEQKVSSLGSGFIIDATGLIVTNNHVIQNADDIRVQLTEKSKTLYKAKVVGRDERTDLAIIKIDTKEKLSIVPLGDSDQVEMGEFVAALGNPLGHGHSITQGIISAKERDIPEIDSTFPFLQTDAGINPGNSGGPLINTAGEVIGVNSAIDARGQAIGFAIPINVLKKLLPDLKTKGRVVRGYLGVGVNNIDEQMVKEFRLKNNNGAIVVNISPGSPADLAQLEAYDIVTEFNGKPIESAKDLTIAVGDTPVGKTVNIKVLREGKTLNLSAKITERPDEQSISRGGRQRPPTPPKGSDVPYQLGISITDLTPQIARQLGIEEAPKKAVVIIGVHEGSLADQAGLQPGDIILDVNKKAVTNAKEAMSLFKKGQNSLRILRGTGTMIVFMEAK